MYAIRSYYGHATGSARLGTVLVPIGQGHLHGSRVDGHGREALERPIGDPVEVELLIGRATLDARQALARPRRHPENEQVSLDRLLGAPGDLGRRVAPRGRGPRDRQLV